MEWGGRREGSGRKKSNPNRGRRVAVTKVPPTQLEATRIATVQGESDRAYANWMAALPQIMEANQRAAMRVPRTMENCPFKIAQHPPQATPERHMAMDSALVRNNEFAATAWLQGDAIFGGVVGNGLAFPGYAYLSELAQQPEYRVMMQTIADDCTRRWIDYDITGDVEDKRRAKARDPQGELERENDPDEQAKRLRQAGKMDKVKALKENSQEIGVQENMYQLLVTDNNMGRAHWLFDFGGEDQLSREELMSPIGNGRDAISRGKVSKERPLRAIRTIEPIWTYPMAYNAADPSRGDWYNPQQWYVLGMEYHKSRLYPLISNPVPDMLKPAYSFGGISLVQMAQPYVNIWLETRLSIAKLIHSFSVMVLCTDLNTLLQNNSAGDLLARVAAFNSFRDNQGTFVINKNTEDFKNVAAQLSGLHELQAQSQEHMASVHRIPLVKFAGIQPMGLNASSEGEIAVYDDTIAAKQIRDMKPILDRTHGFQQLSLFGEIDPEITWRFQPLRVMTEEERGEKEKHEAERDKIYFEIGALSPDDIRQRIIDDPDLPYGGLNPDNLPDVEDEEEVAGASNSGEGSDGDHDE